MMWHKSLRDRMVSRTQPGCRCRCREAKIAMENPGIVIDELFDCWVYSCYTGFEWWAIIIIIIDESTIDNYDPRAENVGFLD